MIGTALAIIQPDELDTIQRTAKLLAASGYFATTGDGITAMAQVASKILAGRELGFGPFAAVNGIHIIQGKPTVGANLMAAAVRAHPRYDYKVKTLTDKACVLEFYDGGKVAGESSFTIEEAATAELSSGKNSQTWKKFPRNMLFARAMSNGVRWYAPDIFSGNAVYVPEELGANVDGDGNVIDTTYTVTQPTQVERCVEPSTGEIVDAIDSRVLQGIGSDHGEDNSGDADNPFNERRVLASQSQRNRMHALGMEYYKTKENWEKKRPQWVRDASGGAVESSNDLTPEQVDWIVSLLEQRIAKRAAANAQEAIATVA